MPSTLVRAFFALAILAGLSGCNPFAFWGDAVRQKAAAETETEHFRRELDSTRFAAIYQAADPEFRNSVSQKDADGLWRMVQRRFGQFQGATLVNWNVSITTQNGTVVRLVYRTGYAQDSATETFTWRIRDGQPALLGYNINSPALLRAMVDEKN